MPCAVVSWRVVGAVWERDGNKADTQDVSGNLRINVSEAANPAGPGRLPESVTERVG